MRILLALALVLGGLGCSSSITVIKPAQPVPESQCTVQLYPSRESATGEGPIEELCIAAGTSSGSFRHTVDVAIRKHKDDVCECGATKAYIQSASAPSMGAATVTLIGFRNVGATASGKE
jgi:hypothetical protein